MMQKKNLSYFFNLLLMIASAFNININAQWVPTERFPSSGGGVFSLTSSGTNVFAGTFNGGVFLTTNGGTSWAEVDSGLTNKSVWSLTISGSNLFAGTNGSGVFLSTNNGTDWTGASSGLPDNTTVYSFAVSGTNIFAGTDDGVFLTTDKGSNWIEKNSGLPNTWARALVVSGSNIFAAVGFSVFLSNDNGLNWIEVNSGLPTNLTIYSLVVSGNNIFVGTNGGGVYLSVDNGANWNEVNTGLTNDVVWAFAVYGSTVFAGTDDGVFVTTGDGSSWEGTEYDYLSVYALAISEMQLFTGGGLSRVYKRPLSEITDVEISDRFPSEFLLLQNYPNPFNPTTKIKYSIPSIRFIKLKINNILGQEIATLVNEDKQPGTYEVEFDASNLNSGIYFYSIEAYYNTKIYKNVKKMVFLK